METKSIPQQVIDSFIENLTKLNLLEDGQTDSLKDLLEKGKFNKAALVSILEKTENHENQRN